MNFENFQKTCIDRIENYLDKLLSLENPLCHSIPHLYEALRYAVLNGGKRMRPLLVYATGEALGNTLELLDAPAAAVELIHCYSLIHDDLPALDNDDLRRGKPTCHKVFGEATAILTGDALQTLAFQLLSDPLLNPIATANKLSMINLLAKKSGLEGMVGGQSLDLAAEGKTLFLTIGDLKEIHQKKTGALIEASVALGALASHTLITAQRMTLLQEYARCIGLAFQIQDDILDIESNTQTLGKSSGKDEKQKKTTFPSKLGLETAKQYAHTLHLQALESIIFLQNHGNRLAELSFVMVNRSS
jgi:geranylgeranyl diphosphate synthase type II